MSKEEQIFLLAAKLWTRKERLGLSSPSSAREPIGESGEVTPVLSDLVDISASLATRMALCARDSGRRGGVGEDGSPTLELALQNDSLAAADRESSSSSLSSTSMSSLSLASRSASLSGEISGPGLPAGRPWSVPDSNSSSAIKVT